MSESYKIFEDLCHRNNVRPADISRATGISTSTFTSWKQGIYEPKPEKLKKIADYFGVSVGYMINGENSDGFYYDKETAELAQQIYQNPELHMLFNATKDASPNELKMFYNMVMVMKQKENEGN